MKTLIIVFVLEVIFTPFSSFAEVNDIIGRVVSVADGDTITVLQDRTQYRIRLYGIDTPEKRQGFGKVAKNFTSSLTFNKKVEVSVYDIDKYGRFVGVVFVDGVNVNKQIVSNGYAWIYQKYCKASFCSDWLDVEEKAKVQKIGLWSQSNPVAPWKYRKNKKKKKD